MNTIEFHHIWKKFRKGESVTSLRDRITNIFNRLFAKNVKSHTNWFWALQDINFHVEKGEVLGIIGPNGAGKSTILKILAGILRPNQGTTHRVGRLSALIEVTAGFHPDLTGRENIYLNGSILGMKRQEIKVKLESIVEFSGIKEFIDTPVKRYSSGMYSRLGFSIAAHVNPDLLLIDEVLAVGDLAFQSKCIEKINQLKDNGVTIIFISHNMNSVQNLCPRALLLDHGRIKTEGATEDVIASYQELVRTKQDKDFAMKVYPDKTTVKINTDLDVEIKDVEFIGAAPDNAYSWSDPLKIRMTYAAKKLIKNPIISLGIIRADGVMCCSVDTQLSGFHIDEIKEEGNVVVDFGKFCLTPGNYAINISIWDSQMLAPFTLCQRYVFKIKPHEGILGKKYGMFIPEVKWHNE